MNIFIKVNIFLEIEILALFLNRETSNVWILNFVGTLNILMASSLGSTIASTYAPIYSESHQYSNCYNFVKKKILIIQINNTTILTIQQ